jgi:AmiR/NasT family two-component response regulator
MDKQDVVYILLSHKKENEIYHLQQCKSNADLEVIMLVEMSEKDKYYRISFTCGI